MLSGSGFEMTDWRKPNYKVCILEAKKTNPPCCAAKKYPFSDWIISSNIVRFDLCRVCATQFAILLGGIKMSTDNEAKKANPAPLGLLGFGMTTLLLNLHNAGTVSYTHLLWGICIPLQYILINFTAQNKLKTAIWFFIYIVISPQNISHPKNKKSSFHFRKELFTAIYQKVGYKLLV